MTKVQTEPKSSPSKPAQSALNSTFEEKSIKKPRPDKHDKVKDGKPVKMEKKGDKKSDGVKKHDSVKKEKKGEGAKATKKHVDSDDDDEPLVSFFSLLVFKHNILHTLHTTLWLCSLMKSNLLFTYIQCFQ